MPLAVTVRQRIAATAIPAVLLASLLACAYGIDAHRLLLHANWDQPDKSRFVAGVLAMLIVALAGLARWRNLALLPVFALAFLALAAAVAGVGPASVVCLQLGAAFCLGRRLFDAEAGDPHDTLLSGAIATSAGFALLSLAVSVASFFPVSNPATMLALLVLPVAVGWRDNVAAARTLCEAWRAAPRPGGAWAGALLLVLAASALLRLLSVLHPEIGLDALDMHLVIAEQLRIAGSFHYDVTRSIWAVMPMAADWQFAIANMLGGEYAARLLNFAVDCLLLACIYLGCARHRGPLAGLVGALVYSTLPLVYLETTSLFVENFWSLWLLTALFAGLASLRKPAWPVVACTGLLVGTAVAAKVTTVFAAPFFLAIAAAWLLASWREGLGRLALFAGVSTGVALLPYANAWLRTGNPLFPFMNDVFRSPLYDAVQPFENPLFASGASWDTLYRATFESGHYLESEPGALGLGLLLLLPAAILYAMFDSARSRVAALCALAFVACVFSFISYLRYVLPVLPVFAMLIGLMVAGVSADVPRLRVPLLVLVVAAALSGLYLLPNATYHHRSVALPPFAGSPAEREYLMHWKPERQLAHTINAMGLRKVLWLGPPAIAQSGADVRLVSWHGGFRQAQDFNALDSKQALERWITANRFDAVAIATGFDACARAFVCEFLDADTTLAWQVGGASLRLPRQELMFARERLANPGFDHDTSGWGGTGSFDPGDGAVRVSATASFSQMVAVEPGGRYLMRVEGRCDAGNAPFRSQVNWMDGNGTFLDTEIAVVPCTTAYRAHEAIVTAPREARTAIVYASGHDATQRVEITAVSFRSP